jgi:hypothetical protein
MRIHRWRDCAALITYGRLNLSGGGTDIANTQSAFEAHPIAKYS